jgi:hypothetical protein
MKSTINFTLFLFAFEAMACFGQTDLAAVRFPKRDKPLAYQSAVTKLLLAEANIYARQLNLPESLPITASTTTEIYVTSPSLAERFGALGSLHTTNFAYGFGRGNHLSYITRRIKGDNPNDYDANKPYAIDPALVNTNAAFSMATQFLSKAFVDVSRLSTSSIVSIHPWVILHMTTSKCTVQWQRKGKPVVKVVLSPPTAELWTLRVEDPSLILRQPLHITNFDYLLSQTNAVVGTNAPAPL